MGTPDAFGRLLEALESEAIPYLIIGMSAAIAQGVMGSTIDIDLWIDLPPRSSMRVLNIARRAGATVGANTVVYLEDARPVNFVSTVTGLGTFKSESRHAVRAEIGGRKVRVLGLRRIQRSKRAVGRDKDHLHVRLIEGFLRCRRGARARRTKQR